jgi:hypothetical protein
MTRLLQRQSQAPYSVDNLAKILVVSINDWVFILDKLSAVKKKVCADVAHTHKRR